MWLFLLKFLNNFKQLVLQIFRQKAQRIKAFEDILGEDVIDMSKLQKLAFNVEKRKLQTVDQPTTVLYTVFNLIILVLGSLALAKHRQKNYVINSVFYQCIPDEKGLRSLVWKILLHYLPKETNAHEATLIKKRQLYKQFINEIVVSPGGPTDHPLNISPDSSWSNYFKDNEVLLQIDKDVRRLCPDISFFQSATEFPCAEIVNSNGIKRLHSRVHQSMLKYSTLERRGLGVATLSEEIRRSDCSGDYLPLNEGSEAHWEVVERMLFLYAKLNPGQGYVQGMNEIIGPIYHTFANDVNKEFREHAEADCFFCFTNLMAEIRDFFIRTLDETESGINNMMMKLSERLRRHDPAVWHLLEQQELRPQYYSFRWLTLLLSQEFSLPDVVRIWDSLFADPHRFDSLLHICCAMILLVRKNLLSGDFASNVKLLQSFPPMDVSLILKKAVEISRN